MLKFSVCVSFCFVCGTGIFFFGDSGRLASQFPFSFLHEKTHVAIPEGYRACEWNPDEVQSMYVFVQQLDYLTVQYGRQLGPESMVVIHPIQDLIVEIEGAFDTDICLPYDQLSKKKQAIYHDVANLIDVLDRSINTGAGRRPTYSRVS